MVGIVLLNVVFVQLTGDASPAWLGPLYALTIAAPLLARFRSSKVYRAIWNAGVVAFFGLLGMHAFSGDLSSVLGDGLILALLCQVHLLNNLTDDQRPDLLFINSFLIAIITGYITADLGFAGAFALYVPFYILGLQFLSLSRTAKSFGAGEIRAVLFDGVKRTAVLASLSALVFIGWPRDFHREAMFAQYVDLSPPKASTRIGFSDEIDFAGRARGADVGRPALEIRPLNGSLDRVPGLWRGATLARMGSTGGWKASPDFPIGALEDARWRRHPDRLGMDRALAPGTDGREPLRVHVTRLGSGTRQLFLPRNAVTVRLDEVHTAGKLMPESDGTASYSKAGRLGYTVELAPDPAQIVSAHQAGALESIGPFLDFEHTVHTRAALGLAQRIIRAETRDRSGGVDVHPSGAVRAQQFATYLREHYPYRAPSDDDAAATLHEFLTTDRGGHCELFASALATMLRSSDVPARVVTGYRVLAQTPQDRAISVSSLHAHAWVEAFDKETMSWSTFDPTPAGAAGAAGGTGPLASAIESLRSAWTYIANFDADRRAAGYAWVRAHALEILAVITAAVCSMLLWRRSRRSSSVTPPEVLALRSTLQTAGLELEVGETPRELLERVGGLSPALSDNVAEAIEVAVRTHETARYASR